ncbi:MAG: RNA-binding S4 domain-containing protein [Halofilum sp. (in: g-proteobacteria)]|nr:RNA-binding S4 domain-containing protein [Halofilum sp. (in: g-proteobacteria)]
MTGKSSAEGLTAAGATAEGSQRVDRWLWAARFFKTRALARKAIDAGKVEVNGARAKAARAIGAGDRLRIGTPAATFEVIVAALNSQRRPASEARQLYTETEESRVAREREAEARRERRAAVVFDRGRPDRRERRASIRFRRRQSGDDTTD